MFNFGENLKKLRASKGLTQEQVAQLLDISKQSVSRWENNITYPDITFLPTLASFYCVTVDSLLGADYEANKVTLDDYESKRHESHRKGDYTSAFEFSQKLYSMFPNETNVMNNLIRDSYLMGLHCTNHKKKHYLELSIAISERLLKMTEDIEKQCRCIKNIALCHNLLENQEVAMAWLKRLPSIWSGIECAALEVLNKQDKIDSIQCTFDTVLHLIYHLIVAYSSECELKDRAKILEKVPLLFEVFFEDGDLGFYHKFLSKIHVELAKLQTVESKEYFGYTEKAMEHAIKFDNLTPQAHTSVLFYKHEILPDEFTNTSQQTQAEWVTDQISIFLHNS